MKNRNSWLDTVNPIRGLSISQAKSIFDCARKYGSALLQKIYDEIENTDPTLMTCVDRRAAAISGIGWQVVARASVKNQNLADQQRLAVDGFLSGIENFDEALEHLDLAFFRGFSHCQPIWEADGTVKRINLLNSWNFLRDKNGEWYFNPEASSDLTGCEKITREAYLMTLTRRRAIDWPALVIFIRKSLGEQDWGRYVERYGLPNFIATMHQGADEKQRDEYLKAARAIRDAQPAAIPNGGTVTTVGTESRGQDPFSNFIEHQEKLIVLMATGGTLTSLAQADTGSLAGGAQMDVWREIVRRDVSAISAVVNRTLVKRFLELKFPGAEIACEFKIEASEKPGKKETADLAVALKNAGYTIVQSELEEAVGFSLVKSEEPPAQPMPFLNKEEPAKKPEKERGVLEAFTDDCSPVADAIKELLKDPSKESADALIKRLPELLPEDPAMAAIIAETMAKEFGETIVKNKDGECRAKDPAHCATHGTPAKAATPDEVKSFLSNPPERISLEQADALLTVGFDDNDADGNTVKYGTLLKDHIERESHSEKDRIARKERLGAVVKVIRSSKPMPSKDPDKPNERIYSGLSNGKAYIGVADEHGELNAIVMVSYRRDGKNDER